MARFLRETYVPGASERDVVGEERYSLAARVYNGIELDLRETYEWGWEQLAWVESEMEATAQRIAPGQGVEAVPRSCWRPIRPGPSRERRSSRSGCRSFRNGRSAS